MKVKIILVTLLLVAGSAQADSVYRWGHWQQDDTAAAILSGADPSAVTAPTAAGPGGTRVQPVINNTVSNPVVSQEGINKLGAVIVVTPRRAGPNPSVDVQDGPPVFNPGQPQ